MLIHTKSIKEKKKVYFPFLLRKLPKIFMAN